MRRRSFETVTARFGGGRTPQRQRPIEVRDDYDIGVELPGYWANHPVLVTESAHNDWSTRRAWWTDQGILLRISRRAGRWADTRVDSLYGIGPAPAVAGLIKKAAPFFDVGRTTVPRGTRAELAKLLDEDEIDVPAPFESAVAATWDWLMTSEAPPACAEEGRVEELTGRSSLESARLALIEAHPGGELSVDEAGSRWFGWRDDSGVLRAIGGASRRVTGRPWVLGSIGVAPAFRGMGIGAAITAAMVRAGLQEAPYVTLGMYAGNEAALRTYQSVGFTVLQEFESSA